MLARHAWDGAGRGDLLEIGAGCGVVAVLLAAWGWTGEVVAVEIQPAMADRVRRNASANGVAGRVRVVEGDARDLAPHLGDRRFDRILSNPPFWPLGSGRRNPDPEREIARHEVLLSLSDLLRVVADRLAPDGLATLLYPAERLPAVLAAVPLAGLSAVRVVEGLPAPGAPARIVLVDLRRGAGLPRCQGEPMSLDRRHLPEPPG